MKADGFPIELLRRGMGHGDQGRALPAFGSELGDDVLPGEATREQPRDERHALPLGEFFAIGAGYGSSSTTRIWAAGTARGVIVAPSVSIAT